MSEKWQFTHLVNHVSKPALRSDNTLYVIGVISNPVRFHSRYRLAREWLTAMTKTPNVKVIMVETAYGDRHHEMEEICHEHDVEFVGLRNSSEIWIKESMINIGGRLACAKFNAQYIAWVDCDVFFRDENWALKTIQELQHFDVVQPWSDCLDLGPTGNVMHHFKSFGHQHQKRIPKQMHPSQPYQYAHSGFAWACTRRFWEAVHGLPDWLILGSADHHAAFACINEVKNTIHGRMVNSFTRMLTEWQSRAMRVTKGEVGYVSGALDHKFHGPKGRRQYRERWQILVDHKFDPDTDISHDAQGLIYLTGKPQLEQDIKQYNRQRAEDSIEEQ